MKVKTKNVLIVSVSLFVLGCGILTGHFIGLKKADKEVINYSHEEVVPVVSDSEKIIRPYTNSNVQIIKNFYDYKSSIEEQINSIIFYGGTYMQSTGIIYGCDEMFDVSAITSGEVIEINEDENFGKTVKIRHQNDIISVYQFLSETTVSLNDKVSAGDVIGKSGHSNVLENDKSQLYLEFIIKGEFANVESYYGKSINEI